MSEEDISQEFRLKKIDEIRNSLIEEVNRNELMSKKIWIMLITCLLQFLQLMDVFLLPLLLL